MATDPGLPTPDSIDNTRKRNATQFTLPRSILLTPSWMNSRFTEDDLNFALAEPTVADEEEARRFGKGDAAKIGERITDRCLVMIGKTAVRMNHKLLTDWKEAIGTKGRQLVDRVFTEMINVKTEDIEAVTATGKGVVV